MPKLLVAMPEILSS